MNIYETEALERLRPYLAECTVLLKSDGSFPLEKAEKISAYGQGVRHTLKGGTGSGEVNSRHFVTVEQGLEKAGFTITNKEWLDRYDDVLVRAKFDFIRQIKQRAKANHTNAIMEGMGAVMSEPEHDLEISDVEKTAIYVVSRICGEGNDRTFDKGDFRLNDSEVRDILRLNKEAERFMLVLNVGGPVDLSEVKEVKNILVLSQLGVDTGTALADILLGISNPSGKLATTWARQEDYPTLGTFAQKDDTDYKEGIYVGYRYFDSANVEPVYPFGFGLSYTDFRIGYLNTVLNNDTVSVKAEVENTGRYAGKETVQLYVSLPDGKLDKAYQELAAFVKSNELKPGEKQELELTFSLRDLASYDEEKQAYVLEKGDYILRLGNSSRDTDAVSVITLDEDVTLRQVKNVFGDSGFKDCVLERRLDDDLSNVEHLNLSSKVFETETVDYTDNYEISKEVEDLSDEQLAYMNIGEFSDKGGLASI
ncbi:MAG: glycoside hydrolase family 3 C-terminal domain-containing protein, partial [Erysipelotrichaceae bacterium]|nr:glycoside hydrolase family 3 C-terminal domain-containing protein [Erysipelotrichaceae bacterium]